MKKADIMMKFLKEEGYAPKLDDDGDIIFKREGLTYILFVSEDDEEFVRLDLPNVWEIESLGERQMVMAAAAEVNRQVKVAKVVPMGDNVWVSAQLLIDPIENVGKVLPRAMNVLSLAVREFADAMRKNR